MADGTHIEWTDATWNPVTGCSVVSPGCTNCYAMKLAGGRLQHHASRAGMTTPSKAGPVWNGQVRFNEAELGKPLSWRRPRLIFVCAHGDLFHESVPDEWIDRVFAVMALSPQHTFQVLTKRAGRMRAYMVGRAGKLARFMIDEYLIRAAGKEPTKTRAINVSWPVASVGDIDHPDDITMRQWPLPNVWLGVSAEDQPRAEERIPDLLATPAAVRFVSAEPLLGPIDLCAAGMKLNGKLDRTSGERAFLDWVIVGGESGPGARPMHPDWARQIRDDCAATGTAFFFKQWGSWLPWQPDGNGVCWRSQAGVLRDRHALGDVDAPGSGWTDACLYEGDDICVHELVSKKAAGRLLDGQMHDAMPERTA